MLMGLRTTGKVDDKTAAAGSGGWPFAHVLTVSTTDPEADYSTIAAAIAAAAAGDVILLDAETYTGVVTLNKNVTLKGSAQGDTVLTLSASGTTLTISTAGAVVEDLTVLNTRATGTNKAVAITANCRLRNVIASSTGAATTNYGIDVSGATVDLFSCEASATGATTKVGLSLVSSSVVNVYGGVYNGATYDMLIDTSTINLFDPYLKNSSFLESTSTSRGAYFDASGYLLSVAQPTFSAYLSTDSLNATGDGTEYTVICDTEIFDRDSNYNNSTGVFTAPVTGQYILTFTVRLTGVLSTHTRGYLGIATSNRTYFGQDYNLFSTMSASGVIGFMITVIADMDAGDTASGLVAASNGTKVVDVGGAAVPVTWFQGYLLP